MKRLLIAIVVLFSVGAAAQTAVIDTVTTWDVDNSAKTNYPVSFGRVFKQGEIGASGQCPRPVIVASSGVVNVSGTNVTWVSGTQFTTGGAWNGLVIGLNGSGAFSTISSVTDSTHLVLTAGAGTQSSVAYVAGTPITAWQADVKNRYGDGTVKFAVISFYYSFSAGGSVVTTYQNATCNNSGYLTQSGMTGFNSANWDFQITATPLSGISVTRSAKTMLGNTDPGADTFNDCKNDYWLQGPVVTAVIVQDCTSSTVYDFGWLWNGTTMGTAASSGNCSGSGATNCTASNHPWFVLSFYPTINSVKCDCIIENPWIGRRQDQRIALDFKAGTGPTTVYSKATFTMSTGQQARKVLWSNADGSGDATGPGHVRFNHNLAYLLSTKAIPPQYDISGTAWADPTSTGSSSDPVRTSWLQFTGGDKGDINGFGGLNEYPKGMSGNTELAPLQRTDLLYLYNMDSSTSRDGKNCGDANSYCAKAWQMNTGERGAIDTLLSAGDVVGGGGVWFNFQNVPFHARESRTTAGGQQSSSTNFFYCPTFADKNTVNNSTACGGSSANLNNATGKILSIHAHSNSSIQVCSSCWPMSAVTGGVATAAGWTNGFPDHNQDYSYVPYLVTGDYYYYEEMLQEGAISTATVNPGACQFCRGTFFGYATTAANVIRSEAGALQEISRAAFLAVDGTIENTYFNSLVDSHLGVLEGILRIRNGVNGITSTLTPSSSQNSFGTSAFTYNANTANRWDYGANTIISQCASGISTCTPIPTALHNVTVGGCPVDAKIDSTKASSDNPIWQYNQMIIMLSIVLDLGFSNAQNSYNEMAKTIVEQGLSSDFNPYLLASYQTPAKNGNSSVNCSTLVTDPFISDYATLKSAFAAYMQILSTFNSANSGNCSSCDHGYVNIFEAALATAVSRNVVSSLASCPNGYCSAAALWVWAHGDATHTGHVPYWGNAVTGSNPVTGTDATIKFAYAPTQSTPFVSLNPTSLSFPNQASGSSSAALGVALTNNGSGTMSSIAISASGDYSETDNCGTSLISAASCTINVTFSPTALGTRTGTLTITSNASSSPDTVSLSGLSVNGSPTSAVSSADFLSIIGGRSATLTWTTTNATGCTLQAWVGGVQISTSPVSCGAGITQSVSPTKTTTYTLLATGAGGTASSSVTINVVGSYTSQPQAKPR
jgi:hypothetical protein